MMINKIVSLIASGTEVICAIKQQKKLVGRSHGCDFPSDVLNLPVLTRANFPTDVSSAEIDSHVKRTLSNGLSVYDVDIDLLSSLKPDLIITQDQCDVCAASLSDVEKIVREYLQNDTQIISLKPHKLDDVYQDILNVAQALGVDENGHAVIKDIKDRWRFVRSHSQSFKWSPKIACIEWIDPLMAAGHWMPEIIEAAGGINLFGETGQASPWISWEQLITADPEVILVLPCGFGIKKTLTEMGPLTSRPEWADLKAVKDGKIYILDGHHYCNRPGPRLKESLEIIAEILHPQCFDFGHETSGWIWYPSHS